VNRTGPVRALRGYVGANSGPTTYRIHAFYEEREEILTALRVHAISGIIDFFDYSPDATGMTFYDELNTGGVTVDGIPEVLVAGEFTWEMITGAQGTLVHTLTIETDISGFDYSSYYCDDITPPETQCTGDDYEYGASGFWEEDPIPNTDPGVGPYKTFEAHRTITYAAPDQAVSFAQACADRVLNPMVTDVSAFAPDTTASVDTAPARGDGAIHVTLGPNPVRGFLYIDFELASEGRLRAGLYDVTGSCVQTVIDRFLDRGTHSVEVDLSEVSTGVYFLRVRDRRGCGVTRRVVVLP
jgi:hypothetical protein